MLASAIEANEWGQCLQLIGERTGIHDRVLDDRNMLHELVSHGAPITVVRRLILTGEIHLLDCTARFGLTALHCAVQRDGGARTEVVECLLHFCPELVRACTVHGSTPLFLACQLKAKLPLVQLLIAAGSDVNAQCYNGSTPVGICAEVGNDPEVVRLLASAGADVNRPGFELFASPLYVACEMNGSLDMIRTLCECGASCTQTAVEGSTALHMAAQKRCSAQVMQCLIQFGGNVNQCKNDGGSAVFTAAQENISVDTMRVMLHAGGGDVNLARLDGQTPLMAACGNNADLALLRLMVDNDEGSNRGGDVNLRVDRRGWSCLMLAVIRVASPRLVAWLLSRGADITLRDEQGRRAVDWARANQDVELEVLIEKAGLFTALLSQSRRHITWRRSSDSSFTTSLIARYFPLELMRRNLSQMLFG